MLISWLTCSLAGHAQDAPTYQTPPKALADLVTAPLTPTVSLSDKGDMMLILEQAAAPGIDELAQPEFKLAGLRLNPANNGPSRARYITGLTLKKVMDKEGKALTGLPALRSSASFNGRLMDQKLRLPTQLIAGLTCILRM